MSGLQQLQDSCRRLGRRPPTNAPALRLANFLAPVPLHPLEISRLDTVTDWDIRGNDKYGDCGPVSVANSRALTTRVLTGIESYPDLNAILDLYRRSGNPNFPSDDNGVVMQDMLNEVHKNGIDGFRCIAYARVDLSDIDELRAAIAIFGTVLLGVNLDVAQQNQMVWDEVGPSYPWGGHAVMAADYTSQASGADIGFISWGEAMALTDAFYWKQLEEAWIVIWPEHFSSKSFMEDIDVNELALAYHALTGRVLPVPITPAPTPPVPKPPKPVPDSAMLRELKKLYHEIGDFLKRHGWL